MTFCPIILFFIINKDVFSNPLLRGKKSQKTTKLLTIQRSLVAVLCRDGRRSIMPRSSSITQPPHIINLTIPRFNNSHPGGFDTSRSEFGTLSHLISSIQRFNDSTIPQFHKIIISLLSSAYFHLFLSIKLFEWC